MDDATQYYRGQFFQEAREILDKVNDDLLRAEADPENREILNAIFRGVHTIKGSAGSFDLNAVSEFAHHLENVLNRLRDGRLTLSPELVDLILSGLDQLHSLLEAAAAGRELLASTKTVADLQAFLETAPESPPAPTPGDAVDRETIRGEEISGETTVPARASALLESDRDNGLNIFEVKTHFTGQHMVHGYDPLVLLRNIRTKAARYCVSGPAASVPSLDDFEPLDLYLSPLLYISTAATARDVADLAFDPDLITVSPLARPTEQPVAPATATAEVRSNLPDDIQSALKGLADTDAKPYRLVLHFSREHLEHGYDPLTLLKNLKKLCSYYRVLQTGPLPPSLGEFEPLHLYLSPSLVVSTRAAREELEDLAFDPDLLSVTPIGPAPADQSLTAAGLDIDPEDLNEFLVESHELLDNLEKSALAYEARGDSESLNKIFRAVHTIKGDSDYLGLRELTMFSHALESMLEQLRSRIITRTPEIGDILLQSADYLRRSVNALKQGRLITELPPIFDKLGRYLNHEDLPAGAPAEPRGYENHLGRAFVEQARQKSEMLQAYLKKISLDEKDIRNLSRVLTGLGKAAEVIGLGSLEAPVQRALSELDRGDSPLFRERAAEVLAFIRGLEEEPKRLGEILIEEGKITEDDLRAGLSQQKPLGAILVAGGKVRREDVERALNKQNLMEAAREARPAIAAEPEIRTMRVDESKIDQFGNFVGELLVVRNTYEYLLKQLGDLDGTHRELIKGIMENQHLLSRLTNDIQHGVMALRMIPIRGIFQRFQRVVRDISRKQKKNIQYVTEGDELEIDKKVADALADPLIHLIRNACDHGVESMADRKAAGKPEKATVLLRASQEGSRLTIRIIDDGKGIDRRKLYEKVIQMGRDVSGPDDPNLLDYIFLPGLSTRDEVSEVSGRGVGMDVVKNAIQSLGGAVQVSSEEGRGAQVVLSIPMTMGVSSVLLVESAGTAYALPLDAVSETLKLRTEKIRRAGRQSVFHYRGRVIALAGLTDLLNGGDRRDGPPPPPLPGLDEDDAALVVIIESVLGKFGLMVDKLVGNMELAIKPVPPSLADIKLYSGVSLMGDGKVLFILNPDYLVNGQ
ncbi:MAG: Hpt domain-containing protein [Pseudomonadota bacterium]